MILRSEYLVNPHNVLVNDWANGSFNGVKRRREVFYLYFQTISQPDTTPNKDDLENSKKSSTCL